MTPAVEVGGYAAAPVGTAAAAAAVATEKDSSLSHRIPATRTSGLGVASAALYFSPGEKQQQQQEQRQMISHKGHLGEIQAGAVRRLFFNVLLVLFAALCFVVVPFSYSLLVTSNLEPTILATGYEPTPTASTNSAGLKMIAAEMKEEFPLLDDIIHLSSAPFRTLLNQANNKSSCPAYRTSNKDMQVTLVVQCSINRVFLLNETCQRWRKDPIVAVVSVRAGIGGRGSQLEQLNSELLTWKGNCPNLKIVGVLIENGSSMAMPERYPVNRLRNFGLDYVETSHVLMADVDFIPSPNLDVTIRGAIVTDEKQQRLGKDDGSRNSDSNIPAMERTTSRANNRKEGWVVPAFELVNHNTSSFIPTSSAPRTFLELQQCNQTGKCRSFDGWKGIGKLAHHSTQQDLWLKGIWYEDDDKGKSVNHSSHEPESRVQRARSVPCIHDSKRYEPYVVLQWCGSLSLNKTRNFIDEAPYYDERFYGYGKNKNQYFNHLHYMGYHLRVLPEGFLVHHPHPLSESKLSWSNRASGLKSRMDGVFPHFMNELKSLYPSNEYNRIPVCKRPPVIIDRAKKGKRVMRKASA